MKRYLLIASSLLATSIITSPALAGESGDLDSGSVNTVKFERYTPVNIEPYINSSVIRKDRVYPVKHVNGQVYYNILKEVDNSKYCRCLQFVQVDEYEVTYNGVVYTNRVVVDPDNLTARNLTQNKNTQR